MDCGPTEVGVMTNWRVFQKAGMEDDTSCSVPLFYYLFCSSASFKNDVHSFVKCAAFLWFSNFPFLGSFSVREKRSSGFQILMYLYLYLQRSSGGATWKQRAEFLKFTSNWFKIAFNCSQLPSIERQFHFNVCRTEVCALIAFKFPSWIVALRCHSPTAIKSISWLRPQVGMKYGCLQDLLWFMQILKQGTFV